VKIIVPIAGPDFVLASGMTKAEFLVDGVPLLSRVLKSRFWANNVVDDDYIFVLKDGMIQRKFNDIFLRKWYPSSKTCFISDHTRGAAHSVLCASGLVGHDDGPIIIDLADIIFDCGLSVSTMHSVLESVSAMGLVFTSNNPIYSYLNCDIYGNVIEAREKQVISNMASAGVYIYKNISEYIRALSYVLDSGEYRHNELDFICPVFNGVIMQDKKVVVVDVSNVIDIKLKDILTG